MTVFEEVIGLAKQLSPLDKLRLIENLTRDIEVSLQTRDVEVSLQTQTTQKRRSLRGLLKGCSISAEEIDQTRKEMWGNFPKRILMPNAVTDTHALIWYLQDDARLSPVALQYLTQCELEGGHICVPSICLVEILYLSEKGRIPSDILDLLLTNLQTQDTVLEIVELNLSIVWEMRNIPRDAVPDMPDRIIAATALHLGMPLISRDRKIQLSEVKTIW